MQNLSLFLKPQIQHYFYQEASLTEAWLDTMSPHSPQDCSSVCSLILTIPPPPPQQNPTRPSQQESKDSSWDSLLKLEF